MIRNLCELVTEIGEVKRDVGDERTSKDHLS